MERLHGAADEIKNDGSQDQGDEQAAEKKSAGTGLVVFEEQVVHGVIDTGVGAKVPRTGGQGQGEAEDFTAEGTERTETWEALRRSG